MQATTEYLAQHKRQAFIDTLQQNIFEALAFKVPCKISCFKQTSPNRPLFLHMQLQKTNNLLTIHKWHKHHSTEWIKVFIFTEQIREGGLTKKKARKNLGLPQLCLDHTIQKGMCVAYLKGIFFTKKTAHRGKKNLWTLVFSSQHHHTYFKSNEFMTKREMRSEQTEPWPLKSNTAISRNIHISDYAWLLKNIGLTSVSAFHKWCCICLITGVNSPVSQCPLSLNKSDWLDGKNLE